MYRPLDALPAFRLPEVKDAHYYRSARPLERALGRLRGTGSTLLDVTDTAWSATLTVDNASNRGQSADGCSLAADPML